MPTTTNYGWTTPADTDLVKDGASAIRTLGSSIDSTLKTQIDAQIPDSLLTSTGDTIYASGASTPARLGIGSTGQVLTVAGGVPTWATQASGTITFTPVMTLTSNWNVRGLATNGSNIMVAVGTSGNLYSSTDSGATWASRTSGFGANSIWHVAFGNGLFVAVGANGTITTSTDGITWTARTAGVSTNALTCVVYANSLWVAVGFGANGGTGGITTSTDGTTWTKRTTPTTSATQLNSVAYGGGYWVAVGEVNTRNGYYSTDAITWTVLPAGMNVAMDYVYYNGSNWMAFDIATSSRYCVGAPSGTWNAIVNPIQPRQVQNNGNCCVGVYNSTFYFIPNTYGFAAINRATTAMTGVLLTSESPAITTPDASNQGVGASLFIDSSGKILYADTSGRLYTAQA